MNIREIILDTETTGLSPRDGHKIVEIGALVMENKILTGEKFHFYLNPQRDMPDEAYRIHGISGESLLDKPLFKDIAADFLEFISGGKLVIHNAAFDIRFLNHELSLVNLPLLDLNDAIDTVFMARRAFPGAKVNLDALCRKFKIDNSSRQYHGALLDAELLAAVYVELTGGRQTSFELRAQIDVVDNINIIQKSMGNKIIIKPNKQEQILHKNFLIKIFN